MITSRARRAGRSALQQDASKSLVPSSWRQSWLLTRLTSPFGLSLLVGIVALAFALYGLGAKTIWWDEAYSLYMARQPAPILWDNTWNWQPNMMAYYYILFGWLKVVSWAAVLPTEFVVRLPSALFGAGSAVVVFLLARRNWGDRVGLLAAGLYLLNTFALAYAQEERAYSLQLLLLALSWYGLVAALTAPHARRWYWWALYIGATSLSMYAQFTSALVIVSQVVAFALLLVVPNAWRARARAQVWEFAVSLIAAGVLVFPIAMAAKRDPHPGWVPEAHTKEVINLVLTYSSDSVVYLALAVLIGAVAILSLAKKRVPGTVGADPGVETRAASASRLAATPTLEAVMPGAIALLCWLIVPILLAYFTARPYLNLHLFLPRYLIMGVPAYCMLIALALSTIRLRTLQVALTILMLGVALWQVPAYYASLDTQGYRTATIWLQGHFKSGDGMVYVPGFWAWVPMSYYMQAYPGPACDDHDPPGINHPTDDISLDTYTATHPRVFVIFAGATGPEVNLDLQHWMDTRYRLVDQFTDGSAVIRLYETGATAQSSAAIHSQSSACPLKGAFGSSLSRDGYYWREQPVGVADQLGANTSSAPVSQ